MMKMKNPLLNLLFSIFFFQCFVCLLGTNLSKKKNIRKQNECESDSDCPPGYFCASCPLPPPYQSPKTCNPFGTVSKPVILFYNFPENQTLQVDLKLDKKKHEFSSIYPNPTWIDNLKTELNWKIKFFNSEKSNNFFFTLQNNEQIKKSSDNTLNNTKNFTKNIVNSTITLINKTYSYLFYETKIKSLSYFEEYLDNSKNFYVFTSGNVTEKIDNLLKLKGLNVNEREDFITYWIRDLTSKNYVILTFMNEEDNNKTTKLEIKPLPDKIVRIMMIFKPVDTIDEEKMKKNKIILDEEKRVSEAIIDRDKLNEKLVIEWGGVLIK